MAVVGKGILLNSTVKAYVKFSGSTSFTLYVAGGVKLWDGMVEYSTNLVNWAEWNGSDVLQSELRNGEYVLFVRGRNNTQITGKNATATSGSWNMNALVSISGRLGALLDWRVERFGGAHTLAERGLAYLFAYANNSTPSGGPVDASQLVAPNITSHNGYGNMFSNCIHLVSAPVLPATTLADGCYQSMFTRCASLVNPPVLPATTVAYACYFSMFMYCTSLVNPPPALLSATIADSSYYQMFYGCTSLVHAPAILATTLTTNSCRLMFSGCTALSELPALLPQTLEANCYRTMFSNCKAIKLSKSKTGAYQNAYRIPMSGTGTMGTDALTIMFNGTGGTFVGTPSINTTYYTSNAIIS